MYFRSIEFNELRAFYNLNGFIVIKNFLSQRQIKNLRIKINKKKKFLKKISLILKKLKKNKTEKNRENI